MSYSIGRQVRGLRSDARSVPGISYRVGRQIGERTWVIYPEVGTALVGCEFYYLAPYRL